ncbi:MAG TPA: restriction endonuclease subunit S [Elusimicrobiales bacterium]|nr:restriction endonuclease subunit S [Elusimicrobiales bacterium]HOL62865.1 restriction endonuclease subunit S [Elusimicrobiales bacterium]HPO94943.1 restriction endonuclease subunit S [Elusimicrobiales bacterium]
MKTNTETKFKQTEMKTVDLNNEILFEFKNGLWESKNDRDSVNAIVIRGTNFSEMGDIKGQLLNIKVENKELENKRLTFGDILIERSGGGPKQPVGRVLFFDINDDKNIYSFSNFVTRLRILQKDILMPRYVFYNLLHFYKFSIGSNFQHGSTGIRNLDFKKYKSDVRIKIIDISEQKKIAGVLSKIQEAVENQRKIIEKLEELKKSTMDKLFKNGLYGKETKQTEIGEIPYDWEVVRLGDVCDTTSGGTPYRNISKYFGGNIPWVKSGELKDYDILDTEEKISEEGLKNSSAKILEKGTLLVAMYGATVGKTGILGIKAATNQAICAILPKNSKTVFNKFIQYFLIKNRNFLIRERYGGAQPNISQQVIKNLSIPLPPLEEQKKIAEILSKIDNMKEEAEKKLDYLNEFFNSALDLLITGKVRLN